MGQTFTSGIGSLRLFDVGLGRPIRVMVVSDGHLSLDDERGAVYQEYSSRMAKAYPMAMENVSGFFEGFSPENYDLLLMLGDMVSFPSCAGVERVLSFAEGTGLPFGYTAGNHDWHFEGMEGTEVSLRKTWCDKVLAPLYQGRNPLFQRIEVGGVDFVLVDTSACVILPEQLELWREQVRRGRPTVMVCHVPLYTPGRSVGYSVGHPDWNASTDKNWKIERRMRWPEGGHDETTFAFHREVFGAENLLCVIAGHVHVQTLDVYHGKLQYTLRDFAHGGTLDLQIC